MKYIKLILIAGLLISNSKETLAANSNYNAHTIYRSSLSDNLRFSIDAGPASPSPSASAFLPVPLFPTLMEDFSEASSLLARRSSVSSLDSLPSDGDLEDELKGPQAALPSRSSLDRCPSNDSSYIVSSELLAALGYEVSTPTEPVGPDEFEGESVPTAPEVLAHPLAALPAAFQPVVAPPATVIKLSSPLEHVSPNRTAGEKRKRVAAPVAMPTPLAKKLSGLFGDE